MMGRAALACLLCLCLVLPAAAEFGVYGADGWPVAADGSSTNPFPGVTAAQLEAIVSQPAGLVAGDPLNQVAGATVYPYWPLLKLEAERMARDHPDLVKLHAAGTSTLGLDLWMMEIADFGAVEAGTGVPLAEREVMWVDGGTHSNEYSGVYFALAWAQFLVEGSAANASAKWILENRHTWVLPMVNPDGSHAFGRLNANGVNINRNYPVDWGTLAEDPLMNNPGPAAGSEVETRLNIDWFNRTRPDYYASIHCCGNLWLYPYGVEGLNPPDQPMFQALCDSAFPEVRKQCGPIWSTIYPASGSSVDTVYEYSGAAAFGFEMSGRGAMLLWGQPITFETVASQERESWHGLLRAALDLHRYGASPAVTDVHLHGPRMGVEVRNDGLGNLTGATLAWVPDGGQPGAPVSLPHLEPGAIGEADLPAPQASGHLQVTYPKRLVANTNIGHLAVPVAVGGEAAPGGFALPAAGALHGAPGFLAVAALLALGLALAARRRS